MDGMLQAFIKVFDFSPMVAQRWSSMFSVGQPFKNTWPRITKKLLYIINDCSLK